MTKRLSKLVALTFALNCVTYTATPLANLSISGQSHQDQVQGQEIHVNVPQMQVFGFGRASARTIAPDYYKTIGIDEDYDKETYTEATSLTCPTGATISISDAKWILEKSNYEPALYQICTAEGEIPDNSDQVATVSPVDSTSTSSNGTGTTSTTGTNTPKTTYTSSITYSTGNSNQATVDANLMLDSLAKLQNETSDAGRNYSQEELDLAYVRMYKNLGLTSGNIESVQAKIEQAEAEAEAEGKEVPQSIKTMKAMLEKYDEVIDRVTGGNNVLGDNTATLEQLAVLRTALKTEQIKSDTECQNKRVENENATCELSAKGKEYASLLSYLENQQVNQTTGSTRTTNATNTGTQNTSTTVSTAYGTVNVGNSTASSSSNSGSGSSSYVTTASGSTVSCNGGVYISSANTCCPSEKPVYSNGKCYTSLSESSSSSSSSDDDDDNNMMMLMMMMMNQNKTSTTNSDGGNNKGNTTGTEIQGKHISNEAIGSHITTVMQPINKNYLLQLGEAETITVKYNASKNLNLKDANGKEVVPDVIVRVPVHYMDANGNERYMLYPYKGKVGTPILILPDTRNGMYYSIPDVSDKAFRKLSSINKETNKLMPWKLMVEVYHPTTGASLGEATVDYYVYAQHTAIMSENANTVVEETSTVTQKDDILAGLSQKFTGEIYDTEYDDAKRLCVLNTKGTVQNNYDSGQYQTGPLDGYTKIATEYIDKENCEKLSGSGKQVYFGDIRAMRDVDGGETDYFTDTKDGRIAIWDSNGDYTSDYIKTDLLGSPQKTSYITGNGWEFPIKVMTDANGELQILELDTEYNKPQSACKDNPACRSYLEEKLGYSLDDISMKEETGDDGVKRIRAYRKSTGEYIGLDKEDGFTEPKTSSKIVSSEHLELVKRMAEEAKNSSEIPTGIQHVISLDYNTNTIAVDEAGNGKNLSTPGGTYPSIGTIANIEKKISTLSDAASMLASYFSNKVNINYGTNNGIPYINAETKFDGTESDEEQKEVTKQVQSFNKVAKGATTIGEISSAVYKFIN